MTTSNTGEDEEIARLNQYLEQLMRFDVVKEGTVQSVPGVHSFDVPDKTDCVEKSKYIHVDNKTKDFELGDKLSAVQPISPPNEYSPAQVSEDQRINTLIPTTINSVSGNQSPENSDHRPLRHQGSIDELRSIQPALLQRNHNVDLTSQSGAGAYAISNPLFRPHDTTAESRPITDTPQDVENSPALVRFENSVDSLVEAHLVEESQTEIVHAEKMPTAPTWMNRRSRLMLLIAVLIIVSLLVVLGITIRGDAEDEPSKLDTETTSNIRNQGNESSMASNGTITISGSGSGSTSKNRTERCIRTTEELYQTITKYWEDTSPNSSVSIVYGWPMRKWCGISNITIFDHLFKVSQQRIDYDSIMPANLTGEAVITASNMVEDIGSWDMRSAQRIESMFEGLQNVSASWGIQKWDTNSLVSMKGVFKNTSWTRPMLNLSSWNTSKVQTMAQLFLDSNVQLPGIAHWDTSRLQTMFRFADGNPYFNEDLSKWNTGSVTTMQKAFRRCTSFNQDLSGWNTRSLEQLTMAFWGATIFHSNIGQWDVSNVGTLYGTFKESNFNNDITTWHVAKVTDMQQTFQHNKAFNQDISAWNVSRVTALNWAFNGASSFSQDLCAWRFSLPTGIPTKNIFQDSGCPNTSDPVSIEEGPFCFNCN
ncbi:receptor-like protein kinase [Seminavis robusta]|uniref:Receptor-like protein kinase n=1 Tax=Seminavis robusta TaxID=568900 RepID=A0A9N8HR31_9STRA|nr:receptor-like protein kinase [Seminavis robusta]|eukprot:Sro1269_g257870.1 receptor-like protein kinase (650) ;mRNA; f:16893-18842